jgi:sterol desaturase/sphingolipid hydroxylase (fatty acid hydroxylase superfamily)
METQTIARAISVVVAFAVAGLGGFCLFRPNAVQDYVLRTQSSSPAWKINPFRNWMQRPSYVTFLRFMGVFMLLFACLLAFAGLASH